MRHSLVLLACVCLVFLLWAAPAEAGWQSWLSGFANRSRVIQICIATMVLALFIMMKKFIDR